MQQRKKQNNEKKGKKPEANEREVKKECSAITFLFGCDEAENTEQRK